MCKSPSVKAKRTFRRNSLTHTQRRASPTPRPSQRVCRGAVGQNPGTRPWAHCVLSLLQVRGFGLQELGTTFQRHTAGRSRGRSDTSPSWHLAFSVLSVLGRHLWGRLWMDKHQQHQHAQSKERGRGGGRLAAAATQWLGPPSTGPVFESSTSRVWLSVILLSSSQTWVRLSASERKVAAHIANPQCPSQPESCAGLRTAEKSTCS